MSKSVVDNFQHLIPKMTVRFLNDSIRLIIIKSAALFQRLRHAISFVTISAKDLRATEQLRRWKSAKILFISLLPADHSFVLLGIITS